MNKFNTENIMHISLLFIHFAEWQKPLGDVNWMSLYVYGNLLLNL